MNKIIIDIETIPNQKLSNKLKPQFDETTIKLGNTKDPDKIQDKIAKVEHEFEEELTKKMSIESNYCQILSLGFIEIDEGLNEIRRDTLINPKGDKSILIALKNIFNKQIIVGWNCKNFDIPIIWKRCILNGIPAPFEDYRALCTPYYDKGCIDLMHVWNGANQYGKMIDCAALLDIESKAGMDGSMIYDAFKEKRFDEIACYNIQDCETTLEIYKKII